MKAPMTYALFASLILAMPALAEDGSRLSRDEVLALVPGSHMNIVLGGAATFSWVNEMPGKLSAVLWHSSPQARVPSTATGIGDWRISDDGSYCGQVGWRAYGQQNMIDWCRAVIRTGDGSYILRSPDGKPDWTMQVSK